MTNLFATMTTDQRIAYSVIGAQQSDAYVMGALREVYGLEEAAAEEAVNVLLDLGLVVPTVCERRDERFGHVAMLRRAA